jgi:hypothetical protein
MRNDLIHFLFNQMALDKINEETNKNRNVFVKNAWRWKCGLPEIETCDKKALSLEEIEIKQSNPRFEKLRTNRMVMGYFRYGEMFGNKKKYDNVGSAIKRLEEYQKTGNAEHLIDVANLCMIEFSQENHKRFHFDSQDDKIHTKELI